MWALPIILSPRKCRNLLPGQGVYLGPATPSKQDGDDKVDKDDKDDKDYDDDKDNNDKDNDDKDNNDKDNDDSDDYEDLCFGDGNQDSVFLYEEPMLREKSESQYEKKFNLSDSPAHPVHSCQK